MTTYMETFHTTIINSTVFRTNLTVVGSVKKHYRLTFCRISISSHTNGRKSQGDESHQDLQ